MSDLPSPPPRPPRRDPAVDPGVLQANWSPPRSGAYKSEGIESVRVISDAEHMPPGEGNGADTLDEASEVEEGATAGDREGPQDASGGDGGGEAAGERGSPARRAMRAAVEWAAVIGGALLVAFVVKTFLVQAFWIPSPSMAETLVKGDRVLVNKLADDIGDIHRGDVIVFKKPKNGDPSHQEGQIEDLIKRVVGLPGDVVESRDGVVFVNDRRLDEPYLAPGMRTEVNGQDMEPVTVPEGHVLVMGDNRTNSHDSRAFGPVPGDKIVGRAFLRVWPLSHFGSL